MAAHNRQFVCVVFFYVAISAVLSAAAPVLADEVRVRYVEGLSRGFLTLRSSDGTFLAEGETTQTMSDDKVTAHLVFHFKDGSLYEDSTTFTERGTFRLLSDHLIQKGPSFKTPMDTSIDTTSGLVTIHYMQGDKPQTIEKKMDLPPDLANGMLYVIVKNIRSLPPVSVSYLAATPNPELVTLVFREDGQQGFRIGVSKRNAIRYLMKVNIGGIKGAAAQVLKKKPADTQFWILDGQAPLYVGSEGPLYGEGPIWRIELNMPARAENSETKDK